MKNLDVRSARDVLDRSHAAWCNGDIECVLSFYTDDLCYWCNAGAAPGQPFVLHGKPAFRTFLHSIFSVTESGSVTEYFSFENDVARATVECFLRHRRTGLLMSGTFRQVVHFRGRKIACIEEYHDAAKMAAFWRLVSYERMADETEEQF